MIDTNVYLSRWPFRRLPLDQTADLVAKLKEQGVEQAWAGSFDAVLSRDVGDVNRRLVEECSTHGDGMLLPFGAVNPTLPDWQEDLRRCAEVYKMRGIRLHPNYHGYTLDDEPAGELLSLSAQARLIVQIAVRMEDVRTQHPLMQVPDVDVQPLGKLLDAHSGLQVVLVNSLRSVIGAQLETLSQHKNLWFEISMQEGIGGLDSLIKQVPYERLLYGSYAPFFYPESAQLKLVESDLGETIRTAIASENAKRLLESML